MNIFPISQEELSILHIIMPSLNSGFGWDWSNDYWFNVDGEIKEMSEKDLEANVSMIREWIAEDDKRKSIEDSAPVMLEALNKIHRRLSAGDLDEWSIKALARIALEAMPTNKG